MTTSIRKKETGVITRLTMICLPIMRMQTTDTGSLGTFDNWKESCPMRKNSAGDWVTSVELIEGQEYKFKFGKAAIPYFYCRA